MFPVFSNRFSRSPNSRLSLFTLVTLACGALLSCGKSYNAATNGNSDGVSIYHAACDGNLGRVRTLLKDNPDLVFSKDEFGVTPLHCAAFTGQRDVAELLLAKKANVDARAGVSGYTIRYEDKSGGGHIYEARGGETPLYFAVVEDHKDVIELLLANKADVNAKDNGGATPLNDAIRGSDKEIAELLLTKGLDVNGRYSFDDYDSGQTPLFLAAEWGHKDAAAWLLAHGADVNVKDNVGHTPLHDAAYRGQKDLAELLLSHGAHVNAKGTNGYTPLHAAVLSGKKDVAEMLIASNADVNAKDTKLGTPLQVAEDNHHGDIAKLLRQHGGHK